MQVSDFDYHLPEQLIAQTPIEPRDNSRLLVVDKNTKKMQDKHFYNLLDELSENDVLVLNKTKVINARLHGKIKLPNNSTLKTKNQDGITVEIFLHKQVGKDTWDCRVYPGRRLKPGKKISFYTNSPSPLQERGLGGEVLEATIIESTLTGRIIKFNKSGIDFLEIVEQLGEMPLPPYIKKELEDNNRYQTVWAEKQGSVAAPTASLHFTTELLKKIKEKGVKIEKVLLHIGLGTFMPILTDNIADHEMHSEYLELEEKTAEKLNKYKKEGKNIIAIGTTAIRVLETMSNENGLLSAGKKETDIFIYPGYNWKFVDSIITNFHLPKSTLLMLVSSFIGKDFTKKAYEHAISQKYRFFSFGDAMFIR